MRLWADAIGLGLFAALLAGPITGSLARAQWPWRCPRAALVLWQAVGLGGGLGIVTAGLALTGGGRNGDWMMALSTIPRRWPYLGVLGWIGLAISACVGSWLIVVAAVCSARVRRARRRHRRQLDAVAERITLPPPAQAGRTMRVRMVDHNRAAAYCLPGVHPRLVVTRGAMQTLPDVQLAAVLAHERAHARGRHDLVVQPFIAWQATFPFLPGASRARAAVELLVEMLADDVALRSCRAEDLCGALRRLAAAGSSTGSSHDSASWPELSARTSRLSPTVGPQPSHTSICALAVCAYLIAVAVVLLPPLLMVWS